MLVSLWSTHYHGGESISHMTRRTFTPRKLLTVASLVALPAGCRDLTLAPAPPELPAGSERMVPLTRYADWWRDTEDCAGIDGDFSRLSWFDVPGRTSFTYGGVQYDGYWWNGVHWILLAGDKIADSSIVRHEMLHELLGRGDHPALYFQERCAGVVACNETCRADD